MDSSHQTVEVNVQLMLDHSRLCRQAYYQIEAICEALLRAAQSPNVEALPYLTQTMVIRINALNTAMMNSNEEDSDLMEDLRIEVFGPGALGINGQPVVGVH